MVNIVTPTQPETFNASAAMPNSELNNVNSASNLGASTPNKSIFPNKKSSYKTKTIWAGIGLLAFVVLASLAVLISMKQSGGGLFAPTAPTSKPKAYIEKLATCSLTFQIPVACNSLCIQSSDCTAVNPDWDCLDVNEIVTEPTATATPIAVSPSPTGSGATPTPTASELNQCTGVDGSSCDYSSLGCVPCSGLHCPTLPCVITPGICTNNVCRESGPSLSPTQAISLPSVTPTPMAVIVVEATPTRIPASQMVTPSVDPTNGAVMGSGVVKRCRLVSNPSSSTCTPQGTPSPTPTLTVSPSPTPAISITPSPTITIVVTVTPSPTTPAISPTPSPTPLISLTPSPTPVVSPVPSPTSQVIVTTVNCNDTCTRNNDCSNVSHICYNGKCRLDVNPESATCTLPTGETQIVVKVIPTRAPAPVELIKAGPADWANYLKIGFGALGIGALLLLFL